MPPQLSVYLVSPDATLRDTVALLLGRAGLRFQLFEQCRDFFGSELPQWAGCALIDQRAFGDNANTALLFGQIRRRRGELPFALLSRHSEPDFIRRAFRAGAIDVLPPGANDAEILAVVEEAFATERKRVGQLRRQEKRDQLLEELTPREREVARILTQGMDNHECAALLGISHRTVEVHKTRVMRKLGSPSLSHLMELLSGAGDK